MDLCVLLFVLLTSASLLRGDSSCMAPSRPVCYKPSRRPDEDFTCQWTPQGGSTAYTYTLHFSWNDTKGVSLDFYTGDKSSWRLGYERGVSLSVPLQVWVSADRGDGDSCSSANTTVQLDQAVKYPAPHIADKGMRRGDGVLYLEFPKPPDNHDADYEFRYREFGDANREWTYKSSTTDKAEKLDAFQMSVQREAAYEVQARRKAKQVRHAEWSDWSEPIYMPLTLEKPLFVTWDTRLIRNDTSRTLRLSWEPPSPGESVGGVKYHLSLDTWPCDKKPTVLQLVNTTHHSLPITLSTANITIHAINNVGQSPRHTVTVPPVPHLPVCPVESTLKMESVKKKKKLKNICWEWYRLEDGQTRPAVVYNDTQRKTTDIKEVADMKDHVRYYYFVHLRLSKKKPHTVFSCPVYKTQSTPQVMPGNLTVVNVSSTSLQVCWQPIPVRQQRGFLTHYLLCLSGDCENLTENQTCKTFQHLSPATEYSISVAGATVQGLGPPATETIWTSEDPTTTTTGTVKKWIIIMVCLFCLCLMAACPLLCMRLRKKLPAVPKPVIVSVKYTPTSQEVPPPKEEVHVATLESMQNTPEVLRLKLEEGRLLLKEDGDDGGEEPEEERGEDEEEEERGMGTDEEQDERMMEMKGCDCISLNPNYKRQTLRIQELTDETTEGSESDAASPVYKNGLFFDVKVELCENVGTSL